VVSFTSSHTALLLKNNLGLLVFCSFLFSLEPMEGSGEAQDRLRILGLAAFVDTLKEVALQLASTAAPWAEVLNVRRKGWAKLHEVR
jgi:hypothetical protein